VHLHEFCVIPRAYICSSSGPTVTREKRAKKPLITVSVQARFPDVMVLAVVTRMDRISAIILEQQCALVKDPFKKTGAKHANSQNAP